MNMPTTAEMVQQNVSAVLTTYNQAYAKADSTARGNLDKVKPLVDKWKQAAYDALNESTPIETTWGTWAQWAKVGQNTYLYQIKTFGELGSVPTLYKLANAVADAPRQGVQAAKETEQAAVDAAKKIISDMGDVGNKAAVAAAKPMLIIAGVGAVFLLLFLGFRKNL
jgi:hypothetical protein